MKLLAVVFVAACALVFGVRTARPEGRAYAGPGLLDIQPQCLHGSGETGEQAARRRDALHATRAVNNLEANQPGSANGSYLRQIELPTSTFMQRASDPFVKSLDFTPGHEVIPGWALSLETSENGYWFMIKDKTDPCGFAYISNTTGLIYTAEPIR